MSEDSPERTPEIPDDLSDVGGIKKRLWLVEMVQRLARTLIPLPWVILVLMGLGSLVTYAYKSGRLEPNQSLRAEIKDLKDELERKEASLDFAKQASSAYENRIAALDALVSLLTKENEGYRSTIESNSLLSEERLRTKQIEEESKRDIRITEISNEARIAEAKLKDAASERDERTRQIESFNLLRSQAVSACIDSATQMQSARTPALKENDGSYFGDAQDSAAGFMEYCIDEYNDSMSDAEMDLMYPSTHPRPGEDIDAYERLRTQAVFACTFAKSAALIESLNVDSQMYSFDLQAAKDQLLFSEHGYEVLGRAAIFLDECSSDFDAKMLGHEESVRQFLQKLDGRYGISIN